MTNDELLDALQLAERMLEAYRRGFLRADDDAANLKILWVLHHLGYQFEWETTDD
jgi:hypothetical protein